MAAMKTAYQKIHRLLLSHIKYLFLIKLRVSQGAGFERGDRDTLGDLVRRPVLYQLLKLVPEALKIGT
jgi:hypothetical protein